MKAKDIVTIQDYETPRTSTEFTEWWNTLSDEYWKTPERITYCREGKGLSKKFHEEAQPMCTFMKSYFSSPSIRCKLSAGNEPADAVLINESDDVIKQIQITFAVDGRNEYLRSRELTRVGLVDGLAKPVEFGHGQNRPVIFQRYRMMPHQDRVNEMLSLVQARIESKSSMGYGTNFAIVVGFSDRNLKSKDVNDFLRLKAQVAHNFSEVYLVGIHGTILVPTPHSYDSVASSK